MDVGGYDPIEAGPLEVGQRSMEAVDPTRSRRFPVQIWYPKLAAAAHIGAHPVVAFSHLAGGNRRSSSFLCTHLASHGYVVGALDHSEVIAPELKGGRQGETAAERAGRIDAIIGSRVPDLRFLLDFLLNGGAEVPLAPDAVGVVGHSAGGWTVLAAAEVDSRMHSVVAITPGGSSKPRPGVLAVGLAYTRLRPVPTLILAAENDVLTPLEGIEEIFDRTPEPKRMFVLRRADHEHFVDDAEGVHEGLRTATLPGDSAWIGAAMRPFAELASADEAHRFARALTLAHFDASLRDNDAAARFLDEAESRLAASKVDAFRHLAQRAR